MNPSEERLSRALRELAATGPQGAPEEVGGRLREVFARHHARRRQRRAAVVALVAVAFAVGLVWLQAGRTAQTVVSSGSGRIALVQAPAVTPTTPAKPAVTASGKEKHVRPTRLAEAQRAKHPTQQAAATTEAFVALPSFDPSVPLGQSRIVRVEMPAADLQLVGYPVDAALVQGRVLADMLVGQDGVPMAVRLVSTEGNH